MAIAWGASVILRAAICDYSGGEGEQQTDKVLQAGRSCRVWLAAGCGRRALDGWAGGRALIATALQIADATLPRGQTALVEVGGRREVPSEGQESGMEVCVVWSLNAKRCGR